MPSGLRDIRTVLSDVCNVYAAGQASTGRPRAAGERSRLQTDHHCTVGCVISAVSCLTGAMSVQLDRQVQDVLGLLENAQGLRQVTNAQWAV